MCSSLVIVHIAQTQKINAKISQRNRRWKWKMEKNIRNWNWNYQLAMLNAIFICYPLATIEIIFFICLFNFLPHLRLFLFLFISWENTVIRSFSCHFRATEQLFVCWFAFCIAFTCVLCTLHCNLLIFFSECAKRRILKINETKRQQQRQMFTNGLATYRTIVKIGFFFLFISRCWFQFHYF